MATTGRTRGIALGWDQKSLDATKARVKRDLDSRTDPEDPSSRLRAVFVHLAELEEDDSDEGRLARYVYAVSALVHHERLGGLTAKDVKHLVALAYAILQAQGVRPRASRLAALYGDVHLIRSQIYRKEGEPWLAAWEQQVGLQLAGDFPSGGLGFQLLGMANRSLRLGHARLAAAQFEESEVHGLEAGMLARCRLGRLLALSLASRHQDATNHRETMLTLASLPEDIKREAEWSKLCDEARASFDLAPMLATIRHGGGYHDATYMIEACIWAMTLESREYLERLPRLAAMRRNQKLKPQRLGLWYECGVTLQECYDHDVPLPIRLKGLSEILERRHELLTVDKELLVLGAATRWLARSKSSSLAVLVYSEYRALSQRLTDGMQDDALGLLGDVSRRDWLTQYYPEGA